MDDGVTVQEFVDAGHSELSARYIVKLVREKDDALREKEDALREKDDALREKDDALRIAEQTVYNAIQVLVNGSHWSVQEKLTLLNNDLRVLVLQKSSISQAHRSYIRQDHHPGGVEETPLVLVEWDDAAPSIPKSPRVRGSEYHHQLDQHAWDRLRANPATLVLRTLVTRLFLAIACKTCVLDANIASMCET